MSLEEIRKNIGQIIIKMLNFMIILMLSCADELKLDLQFHETTSVQSTSFTSRRHACGALIVAWYLFGERCSTEH